MNTDIEKQLEKPKEKDRFPRIVLIIIITEFCERFSYSGMRAFLTLYLRSKLGFSDDGATEAYHIFSTLVYVFPILGGIVADNYIGKFRTIFYMLFIYAAGNTLVALAAIPQLAMPTRLCTMIGLFMVTLSTGGITPCVASFGGDQFRLPEQERHLSVYFTVLYVIISSGSLLSKTICPLLRSEVYCFGDKECYSLAFGAPVLVIILSMLLFMSAKRRYIIKQPKGNVVFDFVKCVSAEVFHYWIYPHFTRYIGPLNVIGGEPIAGPGLFTHVSELILRPAGFLTMFSFTVELVINLGIKNVIMRRNRGDENSHWLDSTRPKYDVKFIKDVKQMLSLMTMFAMLPVFWALIDQFGSRWTLQASRMNGNFGFVRINPDQVQVLIPIFILIMVPIAEKFIYPFLERRNIIKNNLHKMTLAGILLTTSFISSGIVEIYLKTTYPQLPQKGYSQMRIFNGESCPVSVSENDVMYIVPPLGEFTKKDIEVHGFKNVTMRLEGNCFGSRDETFLMEENSAISYFLTEAEVLRFNDKIDKSKSGFPVVRFLVSGTNANTNITLYNDRMGATEAYINETISSRMEVFISTYSIKVGDEVKQRNIELKGGGVYIIVIDNNGEFKSEVLVVTEPNSITMAWLLPQFFLLSAAEVIFNIPGNEFAFKESPESMKAVVTAMLIMAEACGNVIIIIGTRLLANYQQETQTFIYSGLMMCALMVFMCQARGYQHIHGKVQNDRSKSITKDLNGTTEDRLDACSLLSPDSKST